MRAPISWRIICRSLGVGPEVVVGLCVERSLEMMVGLLGILKAGGAYLPLDPGYPSERLAFMLEDVRAPVLLTQSALRDELPAHGGQTVWLDADWPAIARNIPTTAPPNRLHPANTAYVIYTSGSTGTPKGVVVTHQNVVRLFGATEHLFHFGARRCLDIIPFLRLRLFGLGDLGSAAPWRPARRGSLFDSAAHRRSSCALLAREGVSVLNQTPSAFYQLMQADRESEPKSDLSHCVT